MIDPSYSQPRIERARQIEGDVSRNFETLTEDRSDPERRRPPPPAASIDGLVPPAPPRESETPDNPLGSPANPIAP